MKFQTTTHKPPSPSSSLVENTVEDKLVDDDGGDLAHNIDGTSIHSVDLENRVKKFVDQNPPDDAGSEGDDDDEDDERSMEDIAASAAPSIETWRKQLLNVPDALKGSPEVDKLVNGLETVCKKTREWQAAPKKPEQPLGRLRAELEQRQQILGELREHRSATNSGSDHLIDSETDSFSGADLAGDILHAIDSAHEAMQIGAIPSESNKKKIATAIVELKAALKSVDDKKTAEPWKSSATELTLKLNELKEIRHKADAYQSPHSVRNRIDERLVYVDAARRFFESALEDVPDKAKGLNKERRHAFDELANTFIRRLDVRRDALASFARNADSTSGKKDVVAAEAAHTGLRHGLAEGDEISFRTITLNDEESEADLMAAVIDAFLREHPGADQRSGKQLIVLAKSRVLNEQRDWSVVESEVLVPVSSAAALSGVEGGIVGMAKVNTVTTPIGHVFADENVSCIRTSSAVTAARLREYKQQDPGFPDDPNKTVVTGRNSHSTMECAHGVNIARTEMSADGKTMFSGTRHGTLSAFGLYPDAVRSKPQKLLDKLYTDLQPNPPISRATQLYTKDELINHAIANPPPFNETAFDQQWNAATASLSQEQFIDRAKNDEAFCALLRRKAALNRAREVFLAEAIGNPAMLQRIQAGKPVSFTSISLITPDPFRSFLAKIFPRKYRAHDELNMRREEAQAWKDLQEALNNGQFEIDGNIVKAKIISFSTGVNRLAQGRSWGPLARALTSGWNQVESDNRQALEDLIGSPSGVAEGRFGGQLGETLKELTAEYNEKLARGTASDATHSEKLQALAEADVIRRRQNELAALGRQLAGMWTSGDYRHAGEQPYKFAARLARLSFLISGGTAFNCKSGKDRTAQLDLEVKLLSFQSEYRDAGHGLAVRTDGSVEALDIPPPYVGRTDTDKLQLQAFVFHDRTRTAMQRQNTGAEGSKLGYWAELYDSFVPSSQDPDFIGSEFRGRSAGVPS